MAKTIDRRRRRSLGWINIYKPEMTLSKKSICVGNTLHCCGGWHGQPVRVAHLKLDRVGKWINVSSDGVNGKGHITPLTRDVNERE